MKRLTAAIGCLVFVLAACGTAAPSIPVIGSGLPSIAIPSGANPSALASAALTQLCNKEGPASLSTIAGELDKVDANADTTAVEGQLAALLVGLQQLPVSDAAKPLRDAAGTAVLQLQTSIKDPAKRQDAAKKTAGALRVVEPVVCR